MQSSTITLKSIQRKTSPVKTHCLSPRPLVSGISCPWLSTHQQMSLKASHCKGLYFPSKSHSGEKRPSSVEPVYPSALRRSNKHSVSPAVNKSTQVTFARKKNRKRAKKLVCLRKNKYNCLAVLKVEIYLHKYFGIN